jgi:DNA-binding GntR family transcriptional regulator
MHSDGKVHLRRARDEARDLLREGILRGDLAPGAPLEELQVSARLGVSRTPVREALIALEHEGLVKSQPRKGYVVVPANAALVRETYPILAALEAAAVRTGGAKLNSRASELHQLNGELSRATGTHRQHELDRAFHGALVAPCANERLLYLIGIEWTRARRFDGAHARGTADREGSCAEHSAIIAAIERGDSSRAAELLLGHWERGIGVVIKWLDNNA